MIKTDQLQFGLNATAANNAHWRTDGAGGVILSRGNAGAPLSSILSADASGNIVMPANLSIGGNMSVGSDLTVPGKLNNASAVWERLYDFTPTNTSVFELTLPTSHSLFRLIAAGLLLTAGGTTTDFYIRVVQNGATMASVSDYWSQMVYWYGGTGAVVSEVSSYLKLTVGGVNGTPEHAHMDVVIDPGSALQRGGAWGTSRHLANSTNRTVAIIGHQFLVANTRAEKLVFAVAGGVNFVAGVGRITLQGLRPS